jgi:hypothetical protein
MYYLGACKTLHLPIISHIPYSRHKIHVCGHALENTTLWNFTKCFMAIKQIFFPYLQTYCAAGNTLGNLTKCFMGIKNE